jgi:hypothetical protein
MEPNNLYLMILPLIHISVSPNLGFGLTEQTLTLIPSKDWATQFFPDEVETYIATFENRAKLYLTGGHVKGYEIHPEPTDDGRVIVRVVQNVG